MRVVAIIPARLESARFPGKVLTNICGKPMLWHVWNQVRQTPGIQTVVVATDSEVIRMAVEAWNGETVMTAPSCASGTDRIASVVSRFDADFVLNVQGDEPFVESAMLESMILAGQDYNCDVVTPVYEITSCEDLANPHIVKVARTATGRAVYFSRHAVPYFRDATFDEWLNQGSYWGHIGIYGFRPHVLGAFAKLPQGQLELFEKLEQLRFLESGFTIQTIIAADRVIGVDTPADMIAAESRMQAELKMSPTPLKAKVWGTTESVVLTQSIQIDRIVVSEGGFCSWHFHQNKSNGFYVVQGALEIEWDDGHSASRKRISPDIPFLEVAEQKCHRFRGLAAQTIAFEYYIARENATIDIHDIVRLEDGGIENARQEIHFSEDVSL